MFGPESLGGLPGASGFPNCATEFGWAFRANCFRLGSAQILAAARSRAAPCSPGERLFGRRRSALAFRSAASRARPFCGWLTFRRFRRFAAWIGWQLYTCTPRLREANRDGLFVLRAPQLPVQSRAKGHANFSRTIPQVGHTRAVRLGRWRIAPRRL